jgi:two-component system, OmpR family, sensor histidine kinase ChvG
MATSPRSKLSTVSAIDIANAESEAAAERRLPTAGWAVARRLPRRWHWHWNPARRGPPRRGGVKRRPVSPLTGRILAVNVLALAILAGGFLYLGKYQASLIDQQIESLKTQAKIFAAALGEGAVLDLANDHQALLPDLARQMMRRLVEPTQTRARLFDVAGDTIADSRVLREPGAIQIRELPPPGAESLIRRAADCLYDWVIGRFPNRADYPLYHETAAPRAGDYAEVEEALRGQTGAAIRRDPASDGLVFSVAVPVQRFKEVLGAVMLSTGSREIQNELRNVRLELLRIFGVALLVTVLLSVYLAGTIARPIRRLAAAAERARGRRARVEIPDFTDRGDEIGDLSGSLREMTDAVWERMSAIEHFAADVAHEIKNPLSSLRSAVETATRIEDPTNQKRLMAIILDDVERLDRLITDISDASRLDAELSRIELAPVDIAAMLGALAEIHQATRTAQAPQLVLELPDRGRELIVPGIESRLSQVFRNLIANAVSFSPAEGEIHLSARHDGRAVLVTIEDQGPGIPDDKLTAIFDRFYSERPAGEKFGTHSGLGLSISKQIVEAHRGMIWAENRKDADGRVIGARFCIRLPQS